MLQIGSVVDGRYKVLNKIGQGGMSVVYLALNERANKTWAIKEIRKDGVQDYTTVKQGLIAETNILKSLNHKYLPSIADVIDDGDTFLIVMDYVQGKSLNAVLKESMETTGMPIYVDDVINWGKMLCDVFYYLHTRPQPIIYRDMKPANVMLKPDGEICVIDFGTARILKTGDTEDTTCLGTPGYAAPEQYGGSGASQPQTDIYTLGATMHHLITGRNPAATPFNFPRITQVRPSLMDETPRDAWNRLLGLEMVIDKCTKYDMKDRYQNCAELKYDLEHLEELSQPYRNKLKKRLAAFGACLGAAVILGGVALFGKIQENNTLKTGYDYYIKEAQESRDVEDKIDYYKRAIALNPNRGEGYINLLKDAMLEDGEFTVDELTQIEAVLNSRESGRSQNNRYYLEGNDSAYVEFSYDMGMACFYNTSASNNGSDAATWFAHVTEIPMDEVDLGENEPNKEAWYARAEVLGRISGNYRDLMQGRVDQAGDSAYSYSEYWQDLMDLLNEEVAGRDNNTTELRLYKEIAVQISNNYLNLKNQGITKDEMETALSRIETSIDAMKLNQNSVEPTLVEQIRTAIETARNNINAAFSRESRLGR